MKKKLIALLMIAALGASAVACGGPDAETGDAATTEDGGDAATEVSKDLIVGCAVDIQSLDPGRAYEVYASTVIAATYDTLFRFTSESEEPANNLATGYEFTEDALTCTVTLAEEATFANGNPVTSEDVAFSLMRLKNLKDNPSFIMDSVDSIDTPDEHTVVFNLNQPDLTLIAKLTYAATSIIDSTTLSEEGATAGEDAATADTASAAMDVASYGSGPYVMTSYIPDQEVVLERNADYWGEAPYADSITIQVMADANTQMMALSRGDIDIAMNLTLDTVEQIEGTEGVEIQNTATKMLVFMFMNMNSEYGPTADPKVQEALRYAIDYEGLRTMAGEGSVTPASFIQVGFKESLGEMTLERDVDKAKELLAEAGYADGFEMEFPVTTLSAEGIPMTDVAQKLAADFAEVGITLNIQTIDWNGGYADDYRDGSLPASVMYWSPDYNDAINQVTFAAGDYVGLRAGWEATMDQDIADMSIAIKSSTDPTEKDALMTELQEATETYGPFIPLFQTPSHFGYKTGLTGIEYSDSYRIDFRAIAAE